MNTAQSNMYSSIMDALTQVNGFYASMSQEINSQQSLEMLKHADELTGNKITRSYIDGLLEENRQYRQNINQAVSIQQTTDFQAKQVQNRLSDMQMLAEKAASGQYSSQEIEEFQTEFETLMSEIDDIAIKTKPGGFNMLSYTANDMVGIEVGPNEKINMQSMDMTVTSLGIINSMDLINSPETALATVQQAASNVDNYRSHLSGTEQLLEQADQILQNEWTELSPGRAQVDSSVSAWQMLNSLMGLMVERTAFTLSIQANATADEAMKYLLDNV